MINLSNINDTISANAITGEKFSLPSAAITPTELSRFTTGLKVSMDVLSFDTMSVEMQTLFRPASSTNLQVAGSIADFKPDGLKFAKAVQICLNFKGNSISNAGIYIFNSTLSSWQAVLGSSIASNQVCADVWHFTSYGLLETPPAAAATTTALSSSSGDSAPYFIYAAVTAFVVMLIGGVFVVKFWKNQHPRAKETFAALSHGQPHLPPATWGMPPGKEQV